VQEKIQGRVEAYQIPAMLSGSGGGAAASNEGSLAAILARVSEG
jgi:hypothetical protein